MSVPDTIEINCSACGARLRLPASQAGKLGRCAKCQQVFTIPEQSSATPPGSGFDGMLNELKPFSSTPPLGSLGSPPPKEPLSSFGSSPSSPFMSGPTSTGASSNPYSDSPAYAAAPAYGPVGEPYLPPPNSPVPVISLVCGIMCWTICCCYFFSIPVALVAIVTGHVGAGSAVANRGLAIAGMILGYLHVLVIGGIAILSLINGFNQARNQAIPNFNQQPALEFDEDVDVQGEGMEEGATQQELLRKLEQDLKDDSNDPFSIPMPNEPAPDAEETIQELKLERPDLSPLTTEPAETPEP